MAHRLSSRARADLDEIWRHIVLEGAGEPAADNTIDLITDRFVLLSERLTENELSDFSRLCHDDCVEAIIEAQDVDRNHSTEV